MQKELKLVEVHGEKLTTTSLIVAELFGRQHKHVLRSLDKLKDELKMGPIFYTDKSNREQRMYELTERQFLIAMPFIGGVKSFEGQSRLVDEFLRLHKQLNNPSRKLAVHKKRDAHTPMMNALVDMRLESGKNTEAKHFMCENKLCNWLVTGSFAKINEDELSVDEIKLLDKMRRGNENLIDMGMEYAERKTKLFAIAMRYRTKLISS